MCLYPQLIRNKKYTKTKKNKGNIPTMNDIRTEYVSIGCGKCIECTKKRAREWQVRLNEELRSDTSGTFVTLTFSEEALRKFNNDNINIPEQLRENEIATQATRLFLERWRKRYKKSIKHWLITEKGHTNTERIHLHGIIFTNEKTQIEKIWQYGWVYIGEYVNEKTINYIMKYVTKIDIKHKWFTGKILTSPGIGKNYIKRNESKNNEYNTSADKTNEMYRTRTGTKLPLPIYYRNKIYTEEQREQLWINKLNKEERYVCGEKISVSTAEGEKKYEKTRDFYRQKNKQLGYGTINWDSAKYNFELKKIKKETKIQKKNINIEKPKQKTVKQKNLVKHPLPDIYNNSNF